jgi:4-amino-4-deoxy-L-arabinose transferase-like glycosyltransferase
MASPVIARDDARPATSWASAPWVVPGIVALALVVRLALIVWLPLTPFSDAGWYVARANEMAHGLGFQEAGHPTAFWPVGWPALLAGATLLTGSTAIANAAVNMLAALVTVLLIGWFVRTVGGSEGAARIAMLLYAIYPSPIVYTGAALSEVTSTSTAMAAFALLIAGRRRAWMLVLSGLLFGIATLMRAQMLLFPIGAIVALLLVFRDLRWRDAARAALLVHFALAAVVLPWSLRNERALGSFVLVSTNGGLALFTGANDQATGDWFDWEHTPLWDRTGIPFAQRVERQVELDHRFKTLAKDWIAANPARWTALGIKKMALLWRKDTDAFWALDESYPAWHRAWTVAQAADQLYYMLLFALAIWPLFAGAKAVIRRDRGRAPLALLGCMPAFVTLTAFGFTGQIRYHFPAMPFIAAAAGITLAELWRRRRGDAEPLLSRPSGYDRRAA